MKTSDPAPVFVFSVTYLGDLVLATISLDIIARRTGGPLTVVTALGAAPLLERDTRVQRLGVVRSSNPVAWRVEVLRHLLEARRARAHVVNLEVYPPRWRFVRTLCGVAGLTASHLDLAGLLKDNRRSAGGEPVSLPHRAHYYARAAGLRDGDPPPPRLALDPAAAEAIASRLAALGTESGHRLVVVHPGASEAGRRAPPALLAGILRHVASRLPVRAVLVGSHPERSLCDAVVNALGRGMAVVDWVGRLALPELAALLHAADLFIGNDSGPLKMAEAVGARTLSLWGPTGADFAGPRGPGHRTLRFEASEAEGGATALELLAAEAPMPPASG